MTSFYTSVERRGNNILWRGYEHGRPFLRKVQFEPTFYRRAKHDEQGTKRAFIDNVALTPKKFASIHEANDWLDEYDGVGGFGVYGTKDYVTQFIQEQYPDDVQFDMSLINIMNFDIEVDIAAKLPDINLADNAITSISMKSSKQDHYHLLGMRDYDPTKTESNIDPTKIKFQKFETEKDLLRAFINIWTTDYPDIVTGWNVEYFDVQYIITRIIRLFGETVAQKLSPWGSIRKVTNLVMNRHQSTYDISGVAVIDYMDAFKKFGYKYGPQESYKLDHIAHVVLGKNKLDYSEYGGLTELYEQNPQKYLDYNLLDTILIQELEDETALIELVLTVAYSGGVNYSGAFGTVAIWESQLYRYLVGKKNLVPPMKSNARHGLDELIGGFVKPTIVGKHRWVVSFDLDSLYPHLMMQYNMSPETFIRDSSTNNSPEYIEHRNRELIAGMHRNEDSTTAVCPNGARFSKAELGLIPEIIADAYAKRKAIKVEMLKIEQLEQDNPEHKAEYKKLASKLHNSQMSLKIALNSLYGATANAHFLYFIPDVATAITSSGQLSVQWALKALNGYMNKIMSTYNHDYVLAADTDSVYLNFAPLIEKFFGTVDIENSVGEKFLDEICKTKFKKVLDSAFDTLAEHMGAYRNAMSMKREKIISTAIFVAKKRYILNVLNSEGVHYDEPKIAITGLESVRSSTPEICRTRMKELYKLLLDRTEEETQAFIADFKTEFDSLHIGQISKTSSANDLGKYVDRDKIYAKGSPIHIRASLLYNWKLEQDKLDNKYSKIQSGEKMKFIYLKLPNPVRENVIGFPSDIPPEFKLDRYIDYDRQFEAVFLKPVRNVLDSIGWNIEKVSTLESFFI